MRQINKPLVKKVEVKKKVLSPDQEDELKYIGLQISKWKGWLKLNKL